MDIQELLDHMETLLALENLNVPDYNEQMQMIHLRFMLGKSVKLLLPYIRELEGKGDVTPV